MIRKKGHLAILLFIILGGVVTFFALHTIQQTPSNKETTASTSFYSNLEATRGIGYKDSKAKQYDDPWEEWVDKQTEIVLAAFLENTSRENTEPIEVMREQFRAQLMAQAEQLKKDSATPPLLSQKENFEFFELPVAPTIHEGPQTPEALMATFDEKFSLTNPSAVQVDEKYPRAEWLQMLIDKGVPIIDTSDYTLYLNMRYTVTRFENDKTLSEFRHLPSYLGIPTDADIETFIDAYVKRTVWEHEYIKATEHADPEVKGGYFPHSHPDVFLPFKKNRVYVNRSGRGTSTFGELLSEEQMFNLTHRGIHPDGWEVIYIDDDYNTLSEAPPTITREDILDGVDYPTLKEFWEDTNKGVSDPLDPLLEAADDWNTELPKPAVDRMPERVKRAIERAQEMQKRHEQAVREALEITNMSEVELETKLEKLIIPEGSGFPTAESIETTFREQFDPEHFSSERLTRAIETFNRYGPEEGLRRLRKTDPEFAEQMARTLGTDTPPANAEPPPED